MHAAVNTWYKAVVFFEVGRKKRGKSWEDWESEGDGRGTGLIGGLPSGHSKSSITLLQVLFIEDLLGAHDREKTVMTCMDLQGLLLCLKLQASTFFYKTKLWVHNFICGMRAKLVSLPMSSLHAPSLSQPLLWRVNSLEWWMWLPELKPALMQCSPEVYYWKTEASDTKVSRKGHAQMECDSALSVIERRLRNRDVCILAECMAVIHGAHSNPRLYQVKNADHSFFTDFSQVNICKSIWPGRKAGHPAVYNLRAIGYFTICNKLET